jgi:hypothetical protein
MVVAQNSNLSYYESDDSGTTGFDDVGEPIYFEAEQDGYVNVTSDSLNDTRIGEANITSRNDSKPGNVNLELESLHFVYNNTSNVTDNDAWKSLEEPTTDNTDYSGGGSFYVLEYNESGDNADGEWNPGTGDQDVLIYDLDSGTGISKGEVMIYNSDPANNNISIQPGEEFNSTNIQSTEAPSNTYQPSTADVGFSNADGTGDLNISEDNVTVNVSNGGSWGVVNLAPARVTPSGTTDGNYNGDFVSQGSVKVWDVDSNGDSVWKDGLYVDMDNNDNITQGDVRLGHWSVVEGPGDIEKGDLDLQVDLVSFDSSDDITFIDNDDDGEYDPGQGMNSQSNGREAIYRSSNLELESSDDLIRGGLAALTDFNDSTTYVDDDGSGSYGDGEAILLNGGSNKFQLEPADDVLLEGRANLQTFSDEVKFIEDGNQAGFEQGSTESIFYDYNNNGRINNVQGTGGQDHVIVSGTADLTSFSQPPEQEGQKGLAYVDSNGNGNYSSGEDILEITLVDNGSESTVNGTKIFNFADTTRYVGGSTYQSGDNVVNDTDDNMVYEDVLTSLGITNTVTKQGDEPNYFTELATNDLRNGLELYANTSGTDLDPSQDKLVATLTEHGDQTTWNATSFEENITADETFYVVMDVNSRTNLGDKAYVMKANSVNMEFASGLDVSPNNQFRQIVDAHPPEIDNVTTGDQSGGDSTNQSAIFVTIDEYYGGISRSEVVRSDFNIDMPGVEIVSADLGTVGNIFSATLELNETIQTNKTPEVEMNGTIRDYYNNELADTGFIMADDGLEPKIEHVEYFDENVDGTIDRIDVMFSENVTYSTFDSANWAITDRNITGIGIDNGTGTNDYEIEFNASADPGITGVKNETFEPELNFSTAGNAVSDGSGNTLSEVTGITLEDEAAPAIIEAETNDRDLDARIDHINVNFSERLNDYKSFYNPAFSLSSGEIDSVETNTRNDSKLEFDVSEVGFTGDTPNITMAAEEVYDDEPNTADQDQVFTALQDGARPVLLNAEVDPAMSSSAETYINLNFSEEVVDPNPSNSSGINFSGTHFDFSSNPTQRVHSVDLNRTIQTGNYRNITDVMGVKDVDGNLALMRTDNVTVSTFMRGMSEGWNFVSLPLAAGYSPAIDSVYENMSKIESVWTYRNGGWETYDPDAPSNDFTDFEPGRGYLVKATDSFSWGPKVHTPLTQTSEDTTENFPLPSVGVTSGWNLLGQYQEYSLAANQTQTSDPPGAFATFDGSLGRVFPQGTPGEASVDEPITNVNGENENGEKVYPGQAYWVESYDEDVFYAAVEK